MKLLFVSVILSCLAFPVFSQTGNVQRYRNLSDAIGTTLSRSTAALADFDSRASGGGDVRLYVHYLRQYNDLSKALDDSEHRLNFLLKGNAHSNQISEEHRNYANLLRTLETLKTEYDNWLRTVQ